MATNFEFYKDEILKINDTYNHVAVENGKPISCNVMHCKHTSCMDCQMKFIEWLYAEHIEAPKLTKRERAFCEALQTGWIARDFDDYLYIFDSIPHKVGEEKRWDIHFDDEGDWHDLPTQINSLFTFIEWEDEKPWAVEDLLKLEVKE